MKAEPGVVIVANDIFHVVPVFAIVFFAFIHSNLIWFALNRTCARAGGCGRVLYGCYATWCGAVSFFVVYLLVLWFAYGRTVEDVYGAGLNVWYAIGGLLLVGVIVNGIVFACANSSSTLFTEDAGMARYYEARAMLKTDDELFDSAATRDSVQLALRRHLSDKATALMMPVPVAVTTLLPEAVGLRDVEDGSAAVVFNGDDDSPAARVRRRRQAKYEWTY